MTIAKLQQTLEDRIQILERAFLTESGRIGRNKYNVYTLEGRLEEARAILCLVTSTDTRPPSVFEWSKQSRGDWRRARPLLMPEEDA